MHGIAFGNERLDLPARLLEFFGGGLRRRACRLFRALLGLSEGFDLPARFDQFGGGFFARFNRQSACFFEGPDLLLGFRQLGADIVAGHLGGFALGGKGLNAELGFRKFRSGFVPGFRRREVLFLERL